MFRRLFAWMNKYERPLLAVAVLSGFIVDQTFFGRVDLERTQIVFIIYILVCVISIALSHWIETRAERGKPRPRWRPIVPLATQFALGGFWSGFVFFYGHAATLAVSWPYLAFLIAILIGNEVLKKYHDRLVFASVLFFFALYSYTIFEWPIIVGSIGTVIFLESGAIAVVLFALFTILLRIIGFRRFSKDVWRIRAGALIVLVLINFFYFTGILPPLPLSLKAAGVYHSVVHTPPEYTAVAEVEPWPVRLGFENPTLHITPGDSLYAYSAVFAPIALTTTITHRWEWYDPAQDTWVTEAAVAYPIEGGRDSGYLGYSAKSIEMTGKWRVDIETIDGRLIGRVSFNVASGTSSDYTETLN